MKLNDLFFLVCTALIVFVLCIPMTVSASEGSNGSNDPADTIQESFYNWSLTCSIQHNRRKCVISQKQYDEQTGQGRLSIELVRFTPNRVYGYLLLPLDLSISSGVVMHLDNVLFGSTRPFRTCTLAGCIVPIEFHSKLIFRLRTGNKLEFRAVVSNGDDISFTVLLVGFSEALDRALMLVAWDVIG